MFGTHFFGFWAVLDLKLGPSWGQVGAKNRKKSIPKSIKILMLFKIDFGTDFDRFLGPTWSQVGIKIGSKLMSTSKGDFLKKPCFSEGYTLILKVLGVEVGRKIRSKIDKKWKPNRMHLGIDF